MVARWDCPMGSACQRGCTGQCDIMRLGLPTLDTLVERARVAAAARAAAATWMAEGATRHVVPDGAPRVVGMRGGRPVCRVRVWRRPNEDGADRPTRELTGLEARGG